MIIQIWMKKLLKCTVNSISNHCSECHINLIFISLTHWQPLVLYQYSYTDKVFAENKCLWLRENAQRKNRSSHEHRWYSTMILSLGWK